MFFSFLALVRALHEVWVWDDMSKLKLQTGKFFHSPLSNIEIFLKKQVKDKLHNQSAEFCFCIEFNLQIDLQLITFYKTITVLHP